uniref:HTH OST-type domain-containing protein n=1 Tax=Strongyloides papillosus TaxID=174720 RepID=A0A0N5B2V2_STREA
MVGEAIAPGSVEDVMLKVRSCHAEISGMNVERLIRDVKEFWDIDLIDFAYKHNFGPYPNFAAVVNFIRNIEGATLVPMRNRSGNFFVHFKRPDCLAQMVSMIHASKDKKRSRPSFRKNNGQSSCGNYNRSSHSNSSQSLHWNKNQRSTKGAKTRLVYEFYQTTGESGDSKDMKDLQSSKNQDKEQLYKAPNDQQSPNVSNTQQFSENPPETDSGTFENSEFARWYRARN